MYTQVQVVREILPALVSYFIYQPFYTIYHKMSVTCYGNRNRKAGAHGFFRVLFDQLKTFTDKTTPRSRRSGLTGPGGKFFLSDL